MRATFNKLRDLAGKVILPSRRLALAPTLQAQPDIMPAQTPTNLRKRLTSLTITQSQFAQFCNVHPNTVSNWANGRTRMNHAAELVLQVLEADRRSAQYVASQRIKGRPRGKPFAQGNPYRFGDKRRAVYVAAAQIQRAAAQSIAAIEQLTTKFQLQQRPRHRDHLASFADGL